MSRLVGWITTLVLLMGLATGCAHDRTTAKGFSETRTTEAQLEESFAPRRWALVIGVDTYEDPTFTDLHFPSRDARDLAAALSNNQHGRFDRVITLTGAEQTTRANILFELSRLRTDLRRQDAFVLYFSGHGTVELGPDGVPFLYLVTSDASSADLAGTALDLRAVRAFVNDLKPQRKVLVLDSCFSGEGKSRTSVSVRQRLEAEGTWERLSEARGQSEAILMASTLGGVAQEDERLRHGTYTWYLLQALTTEKGRADVDGDGGVTAWEAHDYARVKTWEHTGGAQVPEAWFRLIGQADTYLAGAPAGGEVDNAAALIYGYGPKVGDGLALSIDGQAKGVFPRTMAVEPGSRRVAVSDGAGRVVAEGRLTFAEGQSWSVDELVEELKGYRRFFGVSTGVMPQPVGPAEALWGDVSPSFSLRSGYRVRGGALRGLSLGFELAWMPTFDPSWAAYTEAQRRHMAGVGLEIGVRRDLGRFEAGGGWFTQALYAPGLPLKAEPGLGYGEDLSAFNHGYVMVPTGPFVWGAWDLQESLRLTLDGRLGMVGGRFGQSELGLSTQASMRLGFEVGF